MKSFRLPAARESRAFRLATAILAAAAGIHLAALLAAVLADHWHAPYQDPWGIQSNYVQLPLDTALQVSFNGHHPLLTHVFWYLDFRLFGGTQSMLLVAGAMLYAGVLLSLIRIIAIDRELSTSARLALLAGISLAPFSLANLRNLGFGSEILFTGVPVLMLVLIARWLAAEGTRTHAQRSAPLGWRIALACTLASFSNSAGLLLWPVALLLCLRLGHPRRRALWIAMGATACFGVFFLVLPGGLRSSLPGFPDPWAILKSACITLGAPLRWILTGIIDRKLPLEATLPWCGLVGALGLAALTATFLARWIRARPCRPVEILCLALCMFTAAALLVVATMRQELFERKPGQMFAPRYAIHVCWFWGGLFGLHLTPLLARAPGRIRFARVPLLAAASLVAIAALPEAVRLWRSYAYGKDQNRLACAAVLTGVEDHGQIRSFLCKFPRAVHVVSDHNRQRASAFFGWPEARMLDRRLPVHLLMDPIAVKGRVVRETILTTRDGGQGLRFDGWVEGDEGRGLRAFVALDGEGVVRGIGFPLEGAGRNPDLAAEESARRVLFSGYLRPFSRAGGFQIRALYRDGRASTPIASLGKPRPELELHAAGRRDARAPLLVAPRSRLTLLVRTRETGTPAALFLTEVDGKPFPIAIHAGRIGEDGRMSVQLPVPLVPGEGSLTFMAVALLPGNILLTSPELVVRVAR